METKTLGTGKNILHNLPYESISVTVDKATTGTVLVNGRKILRAGSLVAGDGASIFADRSKKVKYTAGTEGNIDGITLNDVDVTNSDAHVAMVYRGTVRADRVLPAVVANVSTQLKHIVFVETV